MAYLVSINIFKTTFQIQALRQCWASCEIISVSAVKVLSSELSHCAYQHHLFHFFTYLNVSNCTPNINQSARWPDLLLMSHSCFDQTATYLAVLILSSLLLTPISSPPPPTFPACPLHYSSTSSILCFIPTVTDEQNAQNHFKYELGHCVVTC